MNCCTVWMALKTMRFTSLNIFVCWCPVMGLTMNVCSSTLGMKTVDVWVDLYDINIKIVGSLGKDVIIKPA